jgi:hypothetical protein
VIVADPKDELQARSPQLPSKFDEIISSFSNAHPIDRVGDRLQQRY